MENRASRILHFLLFYLGWIGILWAAYVFCLNAYNNTMGIVAENPSFFILLCVSLMSIAIAFILKQTGQTRQ